MLSFGQIILASESPRRQALLHQIGMDFTVIISGIDEDILLIYLQINWPSTLPAKKRMLLP